jgi:hypothetical protein
VTRLVDDACIFLNRPGSRAGRAARCTSPRSRPASARSTGSRTCAGRSRCGSSTTPTTTATSLAAARVEAARLGRGRRRLPLVVHRGPDAFVGAVPGVRGVARRDRRARRAADLRPAGRAAGAARLGAAPPPDRDALAAAVTWRVRGPSWSSVSRRDRRRRRRTDAVLLGERGVLVLFVGSGWTRAIAEPEVERPWTRLLQLSRFFEATMTTLLHDRAPTTVVNLDPQASWGLEPDDGSPSVAGLIGSGRSVQPSAARSVGHLAARRASTGDPQPGDRRTAADPRLRAARRRPDRGVRPALAPLAPHHPARVTAALRCRGRARRVAIRPRPRT